LEIVTDTNVWIDLHRGGIIAEAFRLRTTWLAPDVVIEELREPDGHLLVRRLLKLGLQRVELSGDQVTSVQELAARYRRPSTADLFSLAAAKARRAVLLTGDRRLRDAASTEHVRVHGTLWLLDELVRRRLLNPAKAAAALRRMLDRGSRLPRRDCELRLKRWRGRT
jgi:predicted nucleic acid-binding protein